MKHAGIFGAREGVFGPMLGHAPEGIFGTKEGVFGPMLGQATQLAIPGGVLGPQAAPRLAPLTDCAARGRAARVYGRPAVLGASEGLPGGGAALDDPEMVPEASVYKGDVVTALRQQRGFVAVPAYDLREYVRQQLGTIALGFGVGVAVGAALGNIFSPSR